jgi:Fe-S-cluster containining protein
MNATAEATAIVRGWIADLDARIDRYVDGWEHKAGPVSCRTCTMPACCDQLILATLAEVLPLVERLVAEGRDTPAFRRRLRQEADAMTGVSRDEWFRRRVPCVFLEEGRCTVYDERPTSCRAYFVASPAADCGGPVHTKVAILNCTNSTAATVLQASATTSRALGLRVARHVYMDLLPRTVLRALKARGRKDWPAYVERQGWPTPEERTWR